MNTTTRFPGPPWEMDTAAQRLALEQAAWNKQDVEAIAEGYAENIEMRDGLTFVADREGWKRFLAERFQQQLEYTVRLSLWGALKARMAVRFEAEWQDLTGRWFRSYGVQVMEFTDSGLVRQRFASQETMAVDVNDRQLVK